MTSRTADDNSTKRGRKNTWRGDGNGLRCPVCESVSIQVISTRHHKNTNRRTRSCRRCGFKFHTMEVICDLECNPVETD